MGLVPCTEALSLAFSGTLMHNKELGERGEALARHYLIKQGYQIIASNFRTPQGEIDLVAQKDGVLIFIEVKYRTDLGQGHPAEAITKRKLQNLRAAIGQYLLSSERADFRPIKIDALCIIHLPGSEPVFEIFPDILGP
ncbi:MAG: hypothetical protein DDT36_01022 [Firmicutes bacterium]|nr:hypothetical protein [Bacillota bacterium]